MEPGRDSGFLKKHINYLDESRKPCLLGISIKGFNKKSSDMRVLFDNSHESLIEKHENSQHT